MILKIALGGTLSIFLVGCATIAGQNDRDVKTEADHEMKQETNSTGDNQEELKIIAESEGNFILERPSSSQTNWIADAILHSQIKKARLSAPTFCLLPFESIKSTIKKGEVSNKQIRSLYPDDSKIVWVKLPVSVIPEIENYLKTTNGGSISGAKCLKGKLKIDGVDEYTKQFWLITSNDFLGSKTSPMFFKKRIQTDVIESTIQEMLLEEVIEQIKLIPNNETRISF